MSFLEELVKDGIIQSNQIGDIKTRANESHEGNVDDALIEFGIPEEKVLEEKV